MIDVLTYPDYEDSLRFPSRAVEDHEREHAWELGLELRQYLLSTDYAAAIAAPQAGVALRMFAARSQRIGERVNVFVNPRFEALKNTRMVKGTEGCLSFPGQQVRVKRAHQVRVWWQDVETGQKRGPIVLSDFEARVWQHETDHLDGVLMIDRDVAR